MTKNLCIGDRDDEWVMDEGLDADGGLDGGVTLVARKGDVIDCEGLYVGNGGVEIESGEWIGGACELCLYLIDVIEVDVRIAYGVDEIAWTQACDLRYHVKEEGIAGDVEWDSEEHVGRALIELQGETAIANIELIEAMTWRECHAVNLVDLPGTDDETTTVWVCLNLLNDVKQLVVMAAVSTFPITPLLAVDWPEFTGDGIAPLAPDVDILIFEYLGIGRSRDKPQKLLEDAACEHLFGGYERETFGEIETHLGTEE